MFDVFDDFAEGGAKKKIAAAMAPPSDPCKSKKAGGKCIVDQSDKENQAPVCIEGGDGAVTCSFDDFVGSEDGRNGQPRTVLGALTKGVRAVKKGVKVAKGLKPRRLKRSKLATSEAKARRLESVGIDAAPQRAMDARQEGGAWKAAHVGTAQSKRQAGGRKPASYRSLRSFR